VSVVSCQCCVCVTSHHHHHQRNVCTRMYLLNGDLLFFCLVWFLFFFLFPVLGFFVDPIRVHAPRGTGVIVGLSNEWVGSYYGRRAEGTAYVVSFELGLLCFFFLFFSFLGGGELGFVINPGVCLVLWRGILYRRQTSGAETIKVIGIVD